MSGMTRAELILLGDERPGRWPPQVLALWLEVRRHFIMKWKTKLRPLQPSCGQETRLLLASTKEEFEPLALHEPQKKSGPEIASSCLSDSDFCFDSVLGKLHCFRWFAAQFYDIYCFLDGKEKTPLGPFRICSSVISTYVSLFSGWSWKCVLAFPPFKFIELHSEEPLFLSVGQCVQKGLFSSC